MTEEYYNLYGSVGYNARHFSKVLRSQIRKNFREHKLDVKVEEWITLAFLYQHNDKNQIQLGDLLMQDKTAITRLLDEMEGKKQIKRIIDREDKRNRIIRLTAEGRKAYTKILPLVEKTINNALDGIDLEAYQTTITTLQKMSNNLSKNKKGY